LLKESDDFVDVRIRNRSNQTQLLIAASWPEIPVDLFDFIIDKFIDVVNEMDVDGKTALDIALDFKSKNAESRLRRAQMLKK
jgi:ankyrin repeat protein